MTAVFLNATTFFQFVSLFSSFLFGAWNNFSSWNIFVEQFAHRGTTRPGPAWNNLRIVEQFRGTISASWNNFFSKKRFDFIFFTVKLRAVSWNNSRTVEQFGVPSAFSW
jgi:hypothetical protein